MEIYVDESGFARDDEGNAWFVGKQYAGGTYARRELPAFTSPMPSLRQQRPIPPRPERVPIPVDADLSAQMILAAAASGDARGAAFLIDIQYRSNLTQAQISYRAVLDSKHRRLAFSLPVLPFVNLTKHAESLTVERLTDSERRVVERYFAIEAVDGKPWYRLRSYRLNPGLSKPSGEEGLAAIDRLLARAPNNFLRTIRRQLADGVPISDRQKAVVEKIFAETEDSAKILTVLRSTEETLTAEYIARKAGLTRLAVEGILRRLEKAGQVRGEVPGPLSLRVWRPV